MKLLNARHTKLLGVYVDENLNWKERVNLIANKVYRSVHNKSQILPFYAIVVYLIFCPCLSLPSIWNNCLGVYLPTLNRLVVFQKRIIRVITKSCFDAPSAPLFHEHEILNMTNICIGNSMIRSDIWL